MPECVVEVLRQAAIKKNEIKNNLPPEKVPWGGKKIRRQLMVELQLFGHCMLTC